MGHPDDNTSMADLDENLNCGEFLRLTKQEQRLVILGFANGRGLTKGLFEAYAGAALGWVDGGEKAGMAKYWRSVEHAIAPLLTPNTESLLNGMRVECAQSGSEDRSLIDAFASLHHRMQKALKIANDPQQ